jgi:hypothetical protein
VSYGPVDSAHYYLGVDLAMWALLSGHRAEADSVLAQMLHWRSATGGMGEIFSRSSGGYGSNLPPHPTSAAALVTLVRNALVEDHGDTLQLTLGARPLWWRGSEVRSAPTRFGSIDVSFSADADRARWTWTNVPVWTALTLPPGTSVGGPLPDGIVGAARPDQVLAPPGTGSVEIPVRAAGSSR